MNVALFLRMKSHAQQLSSSALDRALSHQSAGRASAADKAFAEHAAYVRYYNSAVKNLQKALGR